MQVFYGLLWKINVCLQLTENGYAGEIKIFYKPNPYIVYVILVCEKIFTVGQAGKSKKIVQTAN